MLADYHATGIVEGVRESLRILRREQLVHLHYIPTNAASNPMAEHLETFTIDARRSDVRDLCVKYLTGFKYRFVHEEDQSLLFEKGSKRKNFFTFSFDEAYKRVKLSVVGSDKIPVTTVSVLFTLPFLRLRRDEIEGIRSLTKALHKFILITVGYQTT